VFSLKPWKKFGADPFCRFEKNVHLIPKNDVTELKVKATLITIYKAVNRLKDSFRLPQTMVSEV